MYVCVCKGVTDHQIREAVEDGADSLRAVRLRLGVSSQCGCCASCAKSVIDECKSQATPSQPLAPGFGGGSVMAFAAPKKSF
ncbi:BFD-like (2Fe-2S) binding domain family [gamma proteobacterium HTCC5015]|nr:BFD-like (2Fe-2S) binding domain family [gamma proteobacterium HTCC5015]